MTACKRSGDAALPQPCGIITLTTDFGLKDEYVGLLKGVICSRNPSLRPVDLCHGLPPGDIAAATRLLEASWIFFPAGTVHLVVVDPGVGSTRKILALCANDHYFVGPDNGIFTPLFRFRPVPRVHLVTNADVFLPRLSATFHGRDIMAPAAAWLAGGLPLAELGAPYPSSRCIRARISRARRSGKRLLGTVTHADRFGNLVSDISQADVTGLQDKITTQLLVDPAGTAVSLPLVRTYGDVAPGAAAALIGSRGMLEIAVNGGDASRIPGFALGMNIVVRARRRGE